MTELILKFAFNNIEQDPNGRNNSLKKKLLSTLYCD